MGRNSSRGSFLSITVAGELLPGELLHAIARAEQRISHLEPNSFGVSQETSIADRISDDWNRAQVLWRNFRSNNSDASMTASDIREKWLLPLLRLLEFDDTKHVGSLVACDTRFPISHLWKTVPIHLIPNGVRLDSKAAGIRGASKASAFGILQEFLNRSPEHLWGLVSNGLKLRLIRDNLSLVRQAFVEFDFEIMFENDLYSEFRLFWFLCHSSRLQADDPANCILERWSISAREFGVRAREGMRSSLELSIQHLGSGFILHAHNSLLRSKIQDGSLTAISLYRQLLRLAYRLIFLFVIEDKGLLEGQPGYQNYEKFYSSARLRRLAKRRSGTNHHDIWILVRRVFGLLQSGCAQLGLPGLGGDIWNAEVIPDLHDAYITNHCLLAAVRALSRVEVDGDINDIDFVNLRSEELGSVYESLLELEPSIDIIAGRFELLIPEGNERKGTGSYYTPPALVSALLEKSLDLAIEKACRRDCPEESILKLKVLDPTCGSGHFLSAAAHRLARALSRVRASDFEAPHDIYRSSYRDVVESCIYGVDINDMAVELCKLNLWIESFVPGLPLTFLDHRIKVGNSVLGVAPAGLLAGIPMPAFDKKEGDESRCVGLIRAKNQRELAGAAQLNLFESLSQSHHTLRQEVLLLGRADQHSLNGLEKCKTFLAAIKGGADYQREKQIADTWCAAFFWEHTSAKAECPTTASLSALTQGGPVHSEVANTIRSLAADGQYFHWHLEFPDVFSVPKDPAQADNQTTGCSGGFDVIVGNPPYGNAIESNTSRSEAERRIFKTLYSDTAAGAYDKVNLFLHHSVTALLKPDGYYALLQPRTNLSSRGAMVLQEVFNREAPPQYIISPDNSHLFAPAIVFVAGVIGQKREMTTDHVCQVSTSPNLAALEYRSRTLTVPWWTMLSEAPVVVCSQSDDFRRLDTLVNIGAGCTTGAAYELKPLIVDSAVGDGLKLVTTGLIDRYVVKWGADKVRFLKSDFDHPRWPQHSRELPPGVRRAIEAQLSPKVLVAGLVNRIESFYDINGEYGGIVSTFVLKPVSEEIDIRLISPVLNSWLFSYEYLRLYGAKEIGGGGYWSIGKKELQSIPIPVVLFTNDRMRSLLLEHLDEEGIPIDDNEFQHLLCRLVGLSEGDTKALKNWYFQVDEANRPENGGADLITRLRPASLVLHQE